MLFCKFQARVKIKVKMALQTTISQRISYSLKARALKVKQAQFAKVTLHKQSYSIQL